MFVCLIYLFSCFVLNHHPPSLPLIIKLVWHFLTLKSANQPTTTRCGCTPCMPKPSVFLYYYGSVVVDASSTLTMISFDNFYSLWSKNCQNWLWYWKIVLRWALLTANMLRANLEESKTVRSWLLQHHPPS